MGIDITQWRIEIERCWKFAGRKRSRKKSKGVKTVTATTLLCKPLLVLLLSFCLITAPSLLLQAGDVERNPGPLNPKLTIDDLGLILKAAFDATTRWYNIGLELKVKATTLDRIGLQSCDEGSKLRETLKAWLEMNTDPEQTWQDIVNALKSDVVGHPKLAKDIEDKHCNTAEGGQAMSETQLAQDLERNQKTIKELQAANHHLRQQLQQAQQEMEEKQQQLTQDLEQCKQTNEELQAAKHDLRQELQHAQAEVEEKRHAPKCSRRHVQELDEPQQTTTKTQQPPIKQNTIQDMKWDKESTAPETMFRGSVTSYSNIAYFSGRDSTRIHSYNSDTQEWDELHIPDTPHIKHTLVIVTKMLTIVGGFLKEKARATNSILSLNRDENKWTSEFPDMPSKRFNTTAICSGHSLIVAGGYTNAQILTTVEVLNTDAKQWSRASHLLYPFSSATASICGENLYMLGGYDRPKKPTRLVLTCSISELIRSCQTQSSTVWQRVVDSPFYFSSCATVYGQLVLVGGFDKISNEATADIRTYNEKTDSWQTIGLGKMPTAQYRALVVMLRDKLMVVGGLVQSGLQSGKDKYWGTKQDVLNILF